MEPLHTKPTAPSSAAEAEQIDQVCERFLDGLRSGCAESIEDLIADWEEPERSKLLLELILVEIDDRIQTGRKVSPIDYVRRFPGSRDVVDAAFYERLARSKDVEHAPIGGETTFFSVLNRFRYLDEGGLGIIYLAEEQTLKRTTAVKFLHDHLASDRESREQFLLEAEVTARLEHPGVPAVYGLGESRDGRLFYSMRLIHGETFQEAIHNYHQPQDLGFTVRERQMQFRELLNRFVAVCETIAYAHNRGIVHRDIKPKNVMLGRYGETVVVDWGLAMPISREGVFKECSEPTLKPTCPSDSSKRSGGGTPAYMSPEQAQGSEVLGPSSDIYSLGAMLYKILTNEAPFHGKDAREIRESVIRREFRKPSQVRRGVSGALEAICMKAMANEPEARYPTALELAEDVNRYLADARVEAYREPLPLRIARWGRRHQALVQSLFVSLVILAVTGALVSVWRGMQAQRERELRAEAVASRTSEHNLRLQSLQVSAEFAARTIASQIDVRWRILEKIAADRSMHEHLKRINDDVGKHPSSPPDAGGSQTRLLFSPIQEYLDQATKPYAWIGCRSWFIQANEGTQIARAPYYQEDSLPFDSVGRNYAFRDYFHGQATQDPFHLPADVGPLQRPHNSTAMKSTNGGDLTVSLSVPIRDNGTDEVLGVLGMTIELGSFAALQINLPEQQNVLLVESRQYRMLTRDLRSFEDLGDGLLLHHEKLETHLKNSPHALPHLSLDVLAELTRSQDHWEANKTEQSRAIRLLPAHYRDPINREHDAKWVAAFAPVLVRGRDPATTGWFVIVQQRSDRTPPRTVSSLYGEKSSR